jgi:hypothetical protein
VLLAERRIIAALRNHRFSDLFDVNDAIAPLVTRQNRGRAAPRGGARAAAPGRPQIRPALILVAG